MTIDEVKPLLLAQKKMRRKSWVSSHTYIQAINKTVFLCFRDQVLSLWVPNDSDLAGKDWEEFDGSHNS